MGYREPEDEPYEVETLELGHLCAIGIRLAGGAAAISALVSLALWAAGSTDFDWPLRMISSFVQPSGNFPGNVLGLMVVVMILNVIGAIAIRGIRFLGDKLPRRRRSA